jgi:acylphosphatase
VENRARLSAKVYGYVQGVNFRYFVSRLAGNLGLNGYVCNLGDGAVEVEAEGDRNQLQRLIEQLKLGPRGARVTDVKTSWSDYSGEFNNFEIRYRY